MKRIVILISGRGSNMVAIFDAIAAGMLPVQVAAVISNRPDAAGLDEARVRGVDVQLAMVRRRRENAALLATPLVVLDGGE